MTKNATMTFKDFFRTATGGRDPYPYQERFALAEGLPELLNVPTGVGKTATAILGWLYRRRFHKDMRVRQATPRRLPYCLPMRVLVEQTAQCAETWLKNLSLSKDVRVHLLMGGADDEHWDEHPERDAILIGTQDMLLSRALNRGYGTSRYRWPVHFGLLNNDCLWVMDETQLMGVGLTTTAQMQGLRSKLITYGVTHSLWMSATLDTSPLKTVDHPEPEKGYVRQALEADDRKNKHVDRRLNARKQLRRADVVLNAETEKKYAKELASLVAKTHEKESLTLVVLNRVARAQDVYSELDKLATKNSDLPAPVLIHARFRARDRRKSEAVLFDETIPPAGRIVIATQAIEAGVDVSARVLFTELAPWCSLVQRFGRCNRGGEFPQAQVIWMDVQPKDDKDKLSLPYVAADYAKSREFLKGLSDVGPASLAVIRNEKPHEVAHTLRRKDLLDLWDTTPDLAGNDLDVSRFIREGDDTDIHFYWRAFDGETPSDTLPAPNRDELCSVAVGRAREFLKKAKLSAFLWNPLDRTWRPVRDDEIRSGQVLLLKPENGGYSDQQGWTSDASDKPTLFPLEITVPRDAMDDELFGCHPVELAQHLTDVVSAAEELLSHFDFASDLPREAIEHAARWHDVGKAHPAFQAAMRDAAQVRDTAAELFWAKSGERGRPRYRMPDGTERRGFRHELASALAWLKQHHDHPSANLIAFLIAAHHGKVRGSIRSLPNEVVPNEVSLRFARGLWDKDQLPEVDLGNGEKSSMVEIDLSLMSLGEAESGQPSWLTRVLTLRDSLGPFRLSFLETLLRVADWRGSAVGDRRHDK